MKPKLNQKVYMLEEYGHRSAASDFFITPDRAAFLGRSSFVVEGPEDKVPCEWPYEGFGETWFATLAAAKEHAEKIAKKKLKWHRWSNGMYSTTEEEDY